MHRPARTLANGVDVCSTLWAVPAVTAWHRGLFCIVLYCIGWVAAGILGEVSTQAQRPGPGKAGTGWGVQVVMACPLPQNGGSGMRSG